MSSNVVKMNATAGRRARKPMGAWLDEAMRDADKMRADGKTIALPTGVSLMHCRGESMQNIHTVHFAEGKEYKGEDLQKFFEDKSSVYCQDFVGVQSFALLVHYQDHNEPQARFNFIVNNNVDPSEMAFSTTKEGQAQQGMLWGNAFFTMMFNQQNAINNQLLRLSEQNSISLERESREKREAQNQLQELLFKLVMQDRDHELKVLEAQRSIEMRKALVQLAPPLINSIAGRPVFPQETEDAALVRMLLDHVNPAQVMGLAGDLPQEVQVALISRIDRHLKMRQAEREAEQKAQLMHPTSDDPNGPEGDGK